LICSDGKARTIWTSRLLAITRDPRLRNGQVTHAYQNRVLSGP
jgi:hypothetical protein